MSDLWRQGFEHFHAERFFDAHEAWETLWHETSGPAHDALRVLIQAAVVLHHHQQGNREGVERQLQRCRARLAELDTAELWGVDLRAFVQAAARRVHA